VGNNGIRADKPPNRWVVVTRVIVVKTGGIKTFAGEEPVIYLLRC
jgi:hypothetical protein